MMHQYISCLSHLTFTHLIVEMSELCKHRLCFPPLLNKRMYKKKKKTIQNKPKNPQVEQSPEQQEVTAAFRNHQSYLAKTTP